MIYQWLIFCFLVLTPLGLGAAEPEKKEQTTEEKKEANPRFTAPAAGKVKIFYLDGESQWVPPEKGKKENKPPVEGEPPPASCDCEESQQENWVPKYEFFNITLGKQKYTSELTGGTLNPFLVGLGGGSLELIDQDLAWKWFLGVDYGNRKYTKETDSFINVFFGSDVVVFMGTQLAAFNVGPVLGVNIMQFKGVNDNPLNEKSSSLSLGYDLGFSFFPTRDLSIDVGRRMYFPVLSGDVQGDDKENVSNALQEVHQFYITIGLWL